MNLTDLNARIRRLDELARGLSREVILWKACNDPLLYLDARHTSAASRTPWPEWKRRG